MYSIVRSMIYFGFPSLMMAALAPYAIKSEDSLNEVLAREPTPFEILLEERSITNELFINIICIAGLFFSSERPTRMAVSLLGALHMAYLATIPHRVVQLDDSDPDGPAPTNAKITIVMTAIYVARFVLVAMEPKTAGTEKKAK